MAKGLTEQDLDKYKKELIASDVLFAKQLDSLQKSYFPKRLKNISEWSEAEKIKRLILGMNTDKQEFSGNVTIRIKSNVKGNNAGD